MNKPIKASLLAFSIIIATTRCNNNNDTLNKFDCPCSKIGLDSSWADSNNVTCLLIPVPKKNVIVKKEEHFYLAVAVAKSINIATENPLLYLHGGPGIATLGNLPAYLKSTTWKLLREQHDLIFFDYRGTGFSEPMLCNDLEDSLLAFSKTNHSVAEKKDHEILLYKKCKETLLREGTDLVTFTSFQMAADAEEIRKTLKLPAWSIWSAMLSPKSIPFVPLAIHEIANGNDSALQQWSTAFSSSDKNGKYSEQQNKAILCFEARPQSEEDTERSLLLKYPDFASFNSGFATAICNVWRPDTADKKIFEPVLSEVPVLILSGEYDPVCPPYFGAITAKTFAKFYPTNSSFRFTCSYTCG